MVAEGGDLLKMFSVRIESDFSAAHFLSHYHGKCERLHGHNYRVRVWAQGEALDSGGMLLDFGVLKGALKEVLEKLDHGNLNDIADFLGDPSAERIAKYVYEGMMARLPDAPLARVDVFETDVNMASYIPDR
jgi:6-pyruvoyltetrahydropterin/6-carboxytetrahydropterin synthase